MSMAQGERRVLITGANRGLGLALVKVCLARGDRVIGTFREGSNQAHLNAVHREWGDRFTPLKLNVAEPESFPDFCLRVQDTVAGIDLLINNAGIHSKSREIESHQPNLEFGSLEISGMLMMLRTNALGPMLLTQALTPLLLAGDASCVANMSSRRGSLTNKEDGGNYGYCVSKAALNMITRGLAGDLRAHGVRVAAIHPGVVQTDMSGEDAPLTAVESAQAILTLIHGLTLEQSGQFFNWDGSIHPW